MKKYEKSLDITGKNRLFGKNITIQKTYVIFKDFK